MTEAIRFQLKAGQN